MLKSSNMIHKSITAELFRRGLLSVRCRFPPKDKTTLSMVYTPGVGECCMQIKDNPERGYALTNKLNTMFVISDGSTLDSFARVDPILRRSPGLQSKFKELLEINALSDSEHVLPLVEYHAFLYKRLMNIDAYPLVFNSKIGGPSGLLMALRSIATTTQAVELVSTTKLIYEPILKEMDELELVIALPSHKRLLRRALKGFEKGNFSQQYLVNLIMSLVLKFNMHSRRFGILKDKDFKEIAALLNENNFFNYNIFKIMEESFKILRKHCGETANCLYIDNNFVMENELYQGQKPGDGSMFYRVFRDYSIKENAVKVHEHFQGMIETKALMASSDLNNMTQYVSSAEVKRFCLDLLKMPKSKRRQYTIRKNYCAIITDGTAILGYGDIGPLAGLPVMEGKICLFKELADVNVMPFSLESGLTLDQMRQVIKSFSDSWSAINLEDIGAPLCFELEHSLNKDLPIPIFHDDQHGTAIVVLAGLINGLKVVGREASTSHVLINGAGAAGLAICRLLLHFGFKNITLIDSKGAIFEGRPDLSKNRFKEELSKKTNLEQRSGKLGEIIQNFNVFIGVSKANVLSQEMVSQMKPDPIVFALANPTPEIMPNLAKAGGAKVVATGRSDFANQINNSLVFPGIFRGLVDSNRNEVDLDLKVVAATALASVVEEPTADFIIPASLNIDISKIIAQKVKGTDLKPKL